MVPSGRGALARTDHEMDVGSFDEIESPDFDVLKLTPWRIEISAIADMAQGKPPLVWRQDA